jgi:hypothetical protein
MPKETQATPTQATPDPHEHLAKVFGDGNKVVLSSRASLSADIAALASSLGVTEATSQGKGYEPDAFIAAVKRAHDQLVDLEKTNEEQKVKAADLSRREAAVSFREKRADAHDKLETVTSGGLWRWLTCSSRN